MFHCLVYMGLGRWSTTAIVADKDMAWAWMLAPTKECRRVRYEW